MTLDNVHEINPEKARNYLIQAQFLKDEGKFNQALEILEQIINKYEPSNPKAYLMAAETYLENGKYSQALDVVNGFRMPEKGSKEDYTPDEIRLLLCKARALMPLKKYEDCAETIRRVLDIDHSNLEAVELDGDYRLEKRKFQEAIGIYMSLLNRGHNANNMYFSLGVAHQLNNEPAYAYHYFYQLKKMGVADPGLDKNFQSARHQVNEIVVKSDKTMSFLEKFLLRNFPFWAVDRLNAYVVNEISNKKTAEALYTDPLTGVYSKAAVDIYLPNFHAKVTSEKKFFICRLDIDFFKSINDCLGHEVGDLVIKAFGRILKENFPNKAFRVGGDEFLWCFEGTEADCLDRSEKFRTEVETNLRARMNQDLKANPIHDQTTKEPIFLPWNITCSQGIAEWVASGSFNDAHREADSNQYQAKLPSVGRNATFYKMKLHKKGDRPIPYTSVLLKYLNAEAKTRGYATWWHLKDTLKPEDVKTFIEGATKKEEVEKKDAMKAGG